MSIKQKLQQCLLLLLSTPLLIGITPESAPAFRIKQRTQITNDFFDISEFKNRKGKVTGVGITILGSHDPLKAMPARIENWSTKGFSPFLQKIQLGGTLGLLQDLKPYTKQGWSFTKGPDLKGSFDVGSGSYYACGTKKRCGLNPIQSGIGGVGAVLKLNYRPAQKGRKGKTGDPTPQNNLLYWIQRVITNHPKPGKKIGKQTSYIDNRIGNTNKNAIHPYYGSRGNPLDSNGFFGDRPYRKKNLKSNFYWMAELYLAEANPINQQQVTIYNGVRWGWRYQYYSIDELRKKNPLSCPIVNNKKGKTTKASNNKEQQPGSSALNLPILFGGCLVLLVAIAPESCKRLEIASLKRFQTTPCL